MLFKRNNRRNNRHRQSEQQPLPEREPALPRGVVDSTVTGLKINEDGQSELPTRFAWSSHDPLVVDAYFGDVDPIHWELGRDLLAAGSFMPVGESDVRVNPVNSEFHLGRRALRLVLSSPEGTAVIEYAEDDVVDFLKATAHIAPYGTESAYYDIDGTVAAIYAEAEQQDHQPRLEDL